MNVKTLKERLPEALGRWAEERIDAIVRDAPELAVAATYMKRGARNVTAHYAARMDGGVDAAAMFLADESGNIDADTLTEDAVTLLKTLPETPMRIGPLEGSVGGGKVQLHLPDNMVTTLLFGTRKTLTFGEEDLRELAGMLLSPTPEDE